MFAYKTSCPGAARGSKNQICYRIRAARLMADRLAGLFETCTVANIVYGVEGLKSRGALARMPCKDSPQLNA